MKVVKQNTTARLICILLLAVLGGCAVPGYKSVQHWPGDLPERAAVEDVPFYPQDAYYCGPASLAMMLNWAGINVTQAQMAEQVYTPGREGSFPVDLLSAARRNGALGVRIGSMRALLGEIAAGNPVLVFQNLGLKLWPQWHFAVAYEYDLGNDTMVLHSGTTKRHVVDINTFERTWRRTDYWAATVTPPDQLPETAEAGAVVRAAAGLERTEQLDAAATAYEAILGRWPDNIPALMGLGNVMYTRKSFEAAADHFRTATGVDPKYAPAWNNLAYALARSGRQQQAVKAAQRAVSLAQDNPDYQDTLQEIRAGSKPAG